MTLEHQAVDIPASTRERITACRDADTLRTWLTRAYTATHADDIFAED